MDLADVDRQLEALGEPASSPKAWRPDEGSDPLAQVDALLDELSEGRAPEVQVAALGVDAGTAEAAPGTAELDASDLQEAGPSTTLHALAQEEAQEAAAEAEGGASADTPPPPPVEEPTEAAESDAGSGLSADDLFADLGAGESLPPLELGDEGEASAEAAIPSLDELEEEEEEATKPARRPSVPVTRAAAAEEEEPEEHTALFSDADIAAIRRASSAPPPPAKPATSAPPPPASSAPPPPASDSLDAEVDELILDDEDFELLIDEDDTFVGDADEVEAALEGGEFEEMADPSTSTEIEGEQPDLTPPDAEAAEGEGDGDDDDDDPDGDKKGFFKKLFG